MKGPIRSTPEDLESIMELVGRCFPGDRDLAGRNWPYCERIMRNSLIIKDGDRVVSHVGWADQTLALGQAQIRVAGIGWVATDPVCRGRGLMTILLRNCIQLLRRQGYAMSDLAGDRQRYARFGWECAGRSWEYSISARSLGGMPAPKGFDVVEHGNSAHEMEATLRLRYAYPLGLQRDANLQRVFLNRCGKETWIVTKGGIPDSYAVAYRDQKRARVDEFAGSDEGLCSLLSHMIAQFGLESISLFLPWSHPLNRTARLLSSGWHLDWMRMFKVLDLGSTLNAFSAQLAAAYQAMDLPPGKSVTLRMKGAPAAIKISFEKEGIRLERSEPRSGLVLPEPVMAHLLFGPGFPEDLKLPPGMRFLRALLPLDLYIWRNEAV